jgi:hypothetical protein
MMLLFSVIFFTLLFKKVNILIVPYDPTTGMEFKPYLNVWNLEHLD